MLKPPAGYAGKPLPEVRIVTNRLLGADTTEKVLNGLNEIEYIRQIHFSGESLPEKIGSGPNKGLDNKHTQRRMITVCGNDLELRHMVGSFFIELNVENEEMLEDTAGKIKDVFDAHIEHGFTIDIGRYSKYRPSLRDYRGV